MANSEENGDQPITLSDSFSLGMRIQQLQGAAKNEKPLRDPEDSDILDRLNQIRDIIKGTSFETSVLTSVESTISGIESEYSDELESVEEPVPLKRIHYTQVVSDSISWWEMLQADLANETRLSFLKGVVDYELLDEHPGELFEEQEVWGELPDDSKQDLREAIRAAAVGLPTSSVTMSLRALERRLQEWYEDETGREVEDRTFGMILSEIDDYFDDDNRPAILNHLEFLKDRRNQVVHPERHPSRQEAESTLVMVRETLTDLQDK